MANFCTHCGREIPDGVRFCTECGISAAANLPPAAPVPPERRRPAPSPAPSMPPPAIPQPVPDLPAKGSKYEPITTGGYLGSILLMSVPVLGLLIMIIWACGGCRKINKRNLARAMLIFLVISLILGMIAFFVGRSLWNHLLQNSGIAGLITSSGGLGELAEMLNELQNLNTLPVP